jgi:sec-independent protein translocase protein TatB
MLDMSWGEMMVIGAVALIVIGPKDLPKVLRTIGQTTAKVRRMASEFQAQFNEAIREAELDDVRREIQGVNESVSTLNRGFNPVQTIRDELKGSIEGAGNGAAAASATSATDPAEAPPGEELALPPAAAVDLAPPVIVGVQPPADDRSNHAAAPGEQGSTTSEPARQAAEPGENT